MSDVMNAVKKLELEILEKEFSDMGHLEVAIRQGAVEATLLRMKALIAKVSLEEAEVMDDLPDLEINLTYTR